MSESFIGNVAVQTQQSDASHRFNPLWLLYWWGARHQRWLNISLHFSTLMYIWKASAVQKHSGRRGWATFGHIVTFLMLLSERFLTFFFFFLRIKLIYWGWRSDVLLIKNKVKCKWEMRCCTHTHTRIPDCLMQLTTKNFRLIFQIREKFQDAKTFFCQLETHWKEVTDSTGHIWNRNDRITRQNKHPATRRSWTATTLTRLKTSVHTQKDWAAERRRPHIANRSAY